MATDISGSERKKRFRSSNVAHMLLVLRDNQLLPAARQLVDFIVTPPERRQAGLSLDMPSEEARMLIERFAKYANEMAESGELQNLANLLVEAEAGHFGLISDIASCAGVFKHAPQIEDSSEPAAVTATDIYWNVHTVAVDLFETREESLAYVKKIDEYYPLYMEKCGLYAPHDGEVILDYGCGPGNDLVGWLCYSKAKTIIGMDISRRALELASMRLTLHADDGLERLRLIRISDAVATIPLPDASVDHINTLGVLHHTSDMPGILREFRRILRPGGTASVMLYNRDSLYFHLTIAYVDRFIKGRFPPSVSAEEGWRRIADMGAPIAGLLTPDGVEAICKKADFSVEILGGAFAAMELAHWQKFSASAIHDHRLEPEHRAFLAEITLDERGYPIRHGRHVGMDGVYLLRRETDKI
jgi:ubiquinone/menaquinone biosynthesis C-methylase UbiE